MAGRITVLLEEEVAGVRLLTRLVSVKHLILQVSVEYLVFCFWASSFVPQECHISVPPLVLPGPLT